MDPDLARERDRLEREIVALERSIEIELARLDIARDTGLRPRGLAAGTVIGFLVMAAAMVTATLWIMQSISRID